ncbi:MAG: hypothetical protein M3314_06820 [Actinomycetota bacterium]|nr:hypothetical protein [Actinomycetota bacterium]
MAEGVGSRVVLRAREIKARGRQAVTELPALEEFAARPDDARHIALEKLRPELYAISSLIAEATVERAFANRHQYPPYGLVRSGHTAYRMLLANPEVVAEGTISDFYELGKAYVDTMVLHLDAQVKAWLASDEAWMLHRLEKLLALFRVKAGPATNARMRDRFSFIYGGLHFGSGVSVQLVEVMVKLLAAYEGMTADEKVEVLLKSGRPANRLAAFNLDHVLIAYQDLLAPMAPGDTLSGKQTMRWFDPGKFSMDETDGRPTRIDFSSEETLGGRPRGRQLLDVPTTYATLGCPARISPSGGTPPIARLWTWAVQLARDVGLLDAGKVKAS